MCFARDNTRLADWTRRSGSLCASFHVLQCLRVNDGIPFSHAFPDVPSPECWASDPPFASQSVCISNSTRPGLAVSMSSPQTRGIGKCDASLPKRPTYRRLRIRAIRIRQPWEFLFNPCTSKNARPPQLSPWLEISWRTRCEARKSVSW